MDALSAVARDAALCLALAPGALRASVVVVLDDVVADGHFCPREGDDAFTDRPLHAEARHRSSRRAEEGDTVVEPFGIDRGAGEADEVDAAQHIGRGRDGRLDRDVGHDLG